MEKIVMNIITKYDYIWLSFLEIPFGTRIIRQTLIKYDKL